MAERASLEAASQKRARLAWEALYERRPRPWGGAVVLPEGPAHGRVLELGCGGGRLLTPLLRRRPKRAMEESIVVGLDFSLKALGALGPHAHGALVCGEVSRLPFRDGSFELVMCRHVLEHLTEKERGRAASEVLRVLAPGGRGYVAVFSVSDARFGKGTEVERGTFIRGDGILHHYFSADELERLFGAPLVSCREVSWTERVGRGRVRRVVLEAGLEGRRS